jgi:hypothetical protein
LTLKFSTIFRGGLLMTTSITTTTSTTAGAAPTTTTTAATVAVSTGLSNVASSIASSTTTADLGFSAQISAWIASAVEAVRDCLAKLPFIGSWCERSTPVSTTTTIAPAPTTIVYTDAEIVAMIRGQFVPVPGTGSTGISIGVPPADVVDYTLGLFAQIVSPVAKMQAFEAVLGANNSTLEIARDFYERLSDGALTDAQLTAGTREASKQSFRYQMWRDNAGAGGHGSSVYDGHDHGAGFGDHMIYHAIRSPLAQQAVRNVIASM